MKALFLLFLLVSNSVYSFPDNSFEAHFSKRVSVSGYKCEGGEITVAVMNGQWADYKCTSKEWILSVKNSNSDETPLLFTGKLKKSLVKKSDFDIYYNIVPTIPVGPQVIRTLRRLVVRFSPNGEFNVVYK